MTPARRAIALPTQFLMLLTAPAMGQELKLTASDGAMLDRFGASVVLDGGIAIVGATSADGQVPDSGKAYVVDALPKSPTLGQELATLEAADAATADSFGSALALDGGRVLVGSIRDDDGADAAGSAYLFDVDPTGASFAQQLVKLTASNPAPQRLFGRCVALDGGLAAVTARGFAYLFDVDSASAGFGQELALLTPSGQGLEFGSGCALDGGLLAVGDPADGDNGAVAGAVYLFDADPLSASFGQELAKLTPDFSSAGQFFGNALAIADGRLLAGAKNDNAFGEAVGSAHLFDVDLASPGFGTQLAALFPPDPFIFDQFGTSVALASTRAVIGAPFQVDDQFIETGAAYVFDVELSSSTFGQSLAKLTQNAPGFGDQLGSAVALEGELVLAGAPVADDFGSSSGAAYLFALGDAPQAYCTAKVSSAGCLAAIATSNFAAQPTSGAGDYSVQATSVQELKNGLLFAGTSGPAAIPFGAGTLCVNPPLKRGPVLNSGGVDPNDCAGTFSTLVNDGLSIPAGLDAGPGGSAWYQYWYRDPANGSGSFGTALSNALQLDFL